MRDNQGWDLRFRRRLNDWEINKVAELLITLEQYKDLTPNEDNLFWLPGKQDRFSVGSAYERSQRSVSQRLALEDDLESQGTLQGCMFHLATSQTGHTHPRQPYEKRSSNLL
ncbi:hypothetical protein MTR67_023732 [Solanum verrucosum]|uniref:Uncharacterized protein n=1 Tax=Solanum verrucosum TaxID=315347 RepID=A0AAF0QXG8_SOLVR|nr:hypothetical protein MTR67_023732 [Solanum verrucosum]